MEVEVIIGIAAVFVSGTAIGSLATLVVQWAGKKFVLPSNPNPPALDDGELVALRQDVADLTLMVQDLRDRAEFQERILSADPRAEARFGRND